MRSTRRVKGSRGALEPTGVAVPPSDPLDVSVSEEEEESRGRSAGHHRHSHNRPAVPAPATRSTSRVGSVSKSKEEPRSALREYTKAALQSLYYDEFHQSVTRNDLLDILLRFRVLRAEDLAPKEDETPLQRTSQIEALLDEVWCAMVDACPTITCPYDGFERTMLKLGAAAPRSRRNPEPSPAPRPSSAIAQSWEDRGHSRSESAAPLKPLESWRRPTASSARMHRHKQPDKPKVGPFKDPPPPFAAEDNDEESEKFLQMVTGIDNSTSKVIPVKEAEAVVRRLVSTPIHSSKDAILHDAAAARKRKEESEECTFHPQVHRSHTVPVLNPSSASIEEASFARPTFSWTSRLAPGERDSDGQSPHRPTVQERPPSAPRTASSTPPPPRKYFEKVSQLRYSAANRNHGSFTDGLRDGNSQNKDRASQHRFLLRDKPISRLNVSDFGASVVTTGSSADADHEILVRPFSADPTALAIKYCDEKGISRHDPYRYNLERSVRAIIEQTLVPAVPTPNPVSYTQHSSTRRRGATRQ